MFVDNKFWINKKVFITGHTGFVGSWLSLWLHMIGSRVFGYALPPNTTPNLFSILNLENQISSTFGDIRDLEKLSKTIDMLQPDIIIHLAAQPLVRQSYIDPINNYSTNVMGTVNLLESFKQSKSARVLLNITTDKCYENKEWEWGYRENEPLGGYDPYSSSKACSELITSAYRNSFFNLGKLPIHNKAVATARAGNIIGGGDWSQDRLIPDFIRAYRLGQPLIIRNPNAIRPWQYVLEPISGYLKLTERLWQNPAQFSGAWNFGPEDNDCQTVQYLIDKICSLCPLQVDYHHNINNPHEANFLKLDISKAKKQLEWQPQMSIDQAILNTINWFLAYYNSEKILEYSQNEIALFTNKQTEKVLL